MVAAKKRMATQRVVRDKKLAAPAEPNRLPAEPLPKDEPMSAPLPCWSSTSAMMDSEVSTWTVSRKGDSHCMISNSGLGKFRIVGLGGLIVARAGQPLRCVKILLRPAMHCQRGHRPHQAGSANLPHCSVFNLFVEVSSIDIVSLTCAMPEELIVFEL